jgi:hypothetical protein
MANKHSGTQKTSPVTQSVSVIEDAVLSALRELVIEDAVAPQITEVVEGGSAAKGSWWLKAGSRDEFQQMVALRGRELAVNPPKNTSAMSKKVIRHKTSQINFEAVVNVKNRRRRIRMVKPRKRSDFGGQQILAELFG